MDTQKYHAVYSAVYVSPETLLYRSLQPGTAEQDFAGSLYLYMLSQFKSDSSVRSATRSSRAYFCSDMKWTSLKSMVTPADDRHLHTTQIYLLVLG